MFRGIKRSQADDIKILRGDIRHTGGEAKLGGLLGPGGLCCFGGSGGIGSNATSGEVGASSVSYLIEAPVVKGIVRIFGVEEGEFGVMLLLLADSFYVAPWSQPKRSWRGKESAGGFGG